MDMPLSPPPPESVAECQGAADPSVCWPAARVRISQVREKPDLLIGIFMTYDAGSYVEPLVVSHAEEINYIRSCGPCGKRPWLATTTMSADRSIEETRRGDSRAAVARNFSTF